MRGSGALSAMEQAVERINDFAARGVFRAQPLREGGATATAWRLRWFGGHEMSLMVGSRRGVHEVRFDDVLPALPARSAMYRDLRRWLRRQQSADLPPHRRLDPVRYAVTARNAGGRVRLQLKSATVPPGELAERAVQLVNALYHEFLREPGRLEWVIEAFGLDPDNPRLS